jgi:hypothetical protein
MPRDISMLPGWATDASSFPIPMISRCSFSTVSFVLYKTPGCIQYSILNRRNINHNQMFASMFMRAKMIPRNAMTTLSK